VFNALLQKGNRMKRKTKPTKDVVVAFKVEPALAELLDKLPNKSAFIRKAIAAQLGVPCPLCHGKGIVSRGVNDHYAPVMEKHNQGACVKCHTALPVPLDDTDLPEEDRGRLEQFYLGGPLYCDDCYEQLPACSDCGWHIAPESVAEHFRHAHRD
jgi:hypothetical protein